LRLDARARSLHLRALATLAWSSLALRLSSGALRELTASNQSTAVHRASARERVAEIADAIRRAARYVPGSTCLVQALACRRLLQREGYEALIRVGVQPPANGVLAAHAWMEFDGEVILGDSSSPSEFIRFEGFGKTSAGHKQ